MKSKTKFSTLTAAQKRVAIAKDAIKQIKLRKYHPRTRHYMTWDNVNQPFNQKLLTDPKRGSCTVCQLGAALCSALRLGNRFTVQENSGAPEPVMKPLSKWFSKSQIVLMEAAFEQDVSSPTSDCSDSVTFMERCQAKQFGTNYGNDKNRQIAIFENIVKNRGTFKP